MFCLDKPAFICLLFFFYVFREGWGGDLANMQLISKYNKGDRFLLCVSDIYNKYAWVVLVKDIEGIKRN